MINVLSEPKLGFIDSIDGSLPVASTRMLILAGRFHSYVAQAGYFHPYADQTTDIWPG